MKTWKPVVIVVIICVTFLVYTRHVWLSDGNFKIEARSYGLLVTGNYMVNIPEKFVTKELIQKHTNMADKALSE